MNKEKIIKNTDRETITLKNLEGISNNSKEIALENLIDELKEYLDNKIYFECTKK